MLIETNCRLLLTVDLQEGVERIKLQLLASILLAGQWFLSSQFQKHICLLHQLFKIPF